MIYLHTGLPGHGKTLNTIKEVDAISADSGRPVYYNNITDLDASKLKGEWYHFEDPLKWFELPESCIIVIDECQHFFQPRDVRKERPDYIAHFQTHRHRGYDVRRRQKLSATPDLSGTVLPLCLIPNSALKSAPPFKSVVPKASACAGLPA